MQALLVSRAATQSAKKDNEARLERSAESLRLVIENQKLKDQNKVLEELRVLQNDQIAGLTRKADDQEKLIQRMKKTIDQNDETLGNLRVVGEKDAITINDLEAENKQLKAEGAKKGKLIEKLLKKAEDNHNLMSEAIEEIIEKSDQIYLEYKKSRATFGAEPAPLP
jgi:uncharacterized protein YlxW (UPF0749 family)